MAEPEVKRPFLVEKEVQSKREKVPSHVFLLPDERKFPVKMWKDGEWVYDCRALRAAISRAAQHGYRSVEEKARELYLKHCKGDE